VFFRQLSRQAALVLIVCRDCFEAAHRFVEAAEAEQPGGIW
jgi:hypothetical protein